MKIFDELKYNMTRGQLLELQRDINEHCCESCAKFGNCFVMNGKEDCKYKATKFANGVTRYLYETRN